VISRREFLETVAVAGLVPAIARQDRSDEWGSPVFDLHFHLRPETASNLAHLDGAGVTKANLLSRGGASGRSAGTLHLVQQLRRDQTGR
jgi:hypothetical protein